MTALRATFEVEGMSCDHCVAAVRREVSRVPGVDSVDVDLASGRVELTSRRPVDPEAVRAAVEEAGYALR